MKHKDYYNDQYIQEFTQKLVSVMPNFKQEMFLANLIGQLSDKELFARFDCIVDAMRKSMEADYAKNIQAFYNLLGPELEQPEGMFSFGWHLWPIGRYVERYGHEDWRLSLSFIKELTKRFTGEFAIRPLLKEQPTEIMDELIIWTKDENVHIRRLASEAVRIRLPWSQKLLVALDNFTQYSIILSNLRNDPEKFVQKSVGNNLNDLYKEAPEKADLIIAQWQSGQSGQKSDQSKAQEWIIKHGRRNQK